MEIKMKFDEKAKKYFEDWRQRKKVPRSCVDFENLNKKINV